MAKEEPMKAPASYQSGISRRTINDEVHQKLRRALITGTLKPGQTLTIRGLAESLGVGTMPVRDTLKRLVAERGLEMLPNRRVRVPKMSKERLSGLFEIRRTLEGLATEHATPLLSDHQLSRLDELCQEMVGYVKSNDIDSYLAGGNYAFHFTIYAAQENKDLFSMIEGLWLQTGPALREECLDYGLVEGLYRYHQDVMGALRARDAKAARTAIENDITWAVKYYMRNDAEADSPSDRRQTS